MADKKLPNEDFHEVWWIYSDQFKFQAVQMRIAHFRKTINGVETFYILDEPPFRKGIRIWEEVSQREGWRKVEQIPIPKGYK